MAKYYLKYDRVKLEVDLPSEDIISIIEPNEYSPKYSNDKDIVSDALSNPIGTPLLSEIVKRDDKVCLMVNDITRLTKSEIFVPIIIEELNKSGIPDENITILFANGLHKKMDEEEIQFIIGKRIYERIKTAQNDGINGDFDFVGTTSRGNEVYVNKIALEADKLILTGGIIMHHLAGYGGGRKNIIPGCARRDTIFFNHKLMVDPNSEAGNMDNNPLHFDLMEACSFVNPDFIFNVIIDHDGKIAAAVSGDWKEAHQVGCMIADQLYKVNIEEKADIVIASGGGFPKDIDLRQSKKGYYNAARAVKPGGVIISLSACSEGISREGDPFEYWLEKYETLEEIRDAIIADFDIGGMNAYRTREVQRIARLIMITDLDTDRLNEIKLEAYSPDQLQNVIDMIREEKGGNPSIIVMPQAGLTLPQMKL